MTMDVQNKYQTYKESSPDLKETLTMEKASQRLKSTGMPSPVQNKTSKRSFDVAFLMMPDDKMRKKQPERQLRVSKQLFHDTDWEHKKHVEVFKESEFPNETGTEIKDQEEDRGRVNNNMSPGFGSDMNIDVGTDEFPSKTAYFSDSDNSERSRSRPNSNESAAKPPKYLPEYKNKIFDDPTLISMQSRARFDNRYEKMSEMSPKSAFTKVSNFHLRSPNPSVSPDNLMYQNSVSPPLSAASPNSSSYTKPHSFNNLLTPAHLLNGNHFFKAHSVPSSSPNYPESSPMQPRPNMVFNKNDYNEKQGDSKAPHMSQNKMTFLPFRPEIPYLQAGSSYPFGVQNFQGSHSDFMKIPGPPREPPLIANPAAALLSTLLPPTLAAFSMPAQNVCAKCSINFRMTSDLVYHMRTHHKSETTADPHRRKREEKLKCPVCNESFRERHHLTRHMTAHQDKEGDLDEVPASQSFNKKNKQLYSHSSSSLMHK